MKLSELTTGESGIIVKVHGHGGFRKRIIEMGFVRGQTVRVLQNAPLQDPVIYQLMGYEVSLRHQEAEMIEVFNGDGDDDTSIPGNGLQGHAPDITPESHPDDYLHHMAMRRHRTLNVALVGNPNCGKTSLFNFASGVILFPLLLI